MTASSQRKPLADADVLNYYLHIMLVKSLYHRPIYESSGKQLQWHDCNPRVAPIIPRDEIDIGFDKNIEQYWTEGIYSMIKMEWF